MKKYCIEYKKEDYDLVNKLLGRFASCIYIVDENGCKEYRFENLSRLLNLAKEKKTEVYCKTVNESYLVAGLGYKGVGLSDEIIRQARMYADFGE